MVTRPMKLLIETSAVRAAVGASMTEQESRLRELVGEGELWASCYIRKEFIARWIADAVRMATTIAQCNSVADALIYMEQDFSPRNVKGMVAMIADLLRARGVLQNSQQAAEEVASDAVRLLKAFDRILGRRINNTSKCERGSAKPEVDYNNLLRSLVKFYEAFQVPVADCGVNGFLALSKENGRASKLLNDERTRRLDSASNLRELRAGGTWITCKECRKIGDVIIALEQPSGWTIVHVDEAFAVLCPCLKRNNMPLPSVRKASNEAKRAAGAIDPSDAGMT